MSEDKFLFIQDHGECDYMEYLKYCQELILSFMLTTPSTSPFLKQNARPFADDKWKTILDDSTDPVAKGTWSSHKEDPSWMGGIRRYSAAKLCSVMMMYSTLPLYPSLLCSFISTPRSPTPFAGLN
jgi:hypothetical protein